MSTTVRYPTRGDLPHARDPDVAWGASGRLEARGGEMRSTRRCLAVAALALGTATAGCGYDKTGNEREVLGVFAAKYPEARWGVECMDGDGPDSNPKCTVGAIAIRNRDAIVAARYGAHGVFHAIDISCPEPRDNLASTSPTPVVAHVWRPD